MTTCTRPELQHYLTNFTREDPLLAVYCAYAGDAGMGMGSLAALLIFGSVGLALTIRVQHPGPIIIVGVLTAGAIAPQLPGAGVNIYALVLLVAIAGAGLYLYQRAQNSL